jgi:hypothetical protein
MKPQTPQTVPSEQIINPGTDIINKTQSIKLI